MTSVLSLQLDLRRLILKSVELSARGSKEPPVSMAGELSPHTRATEPVSDHLLFTHPAVGCGWLCVAALTLPSLPQKTTFLPCPDSSLSSRVSTRTSTRSRTSAAPCARGSITSGSVSLKLCFCAPFVLKCASCSPRAAPVLYPKYYDTHQRCARTSDRRLTSFRVCVSHTGT